MSDFESGAGEPCHVCIGIPALADDAYLARLRRIPGVVPEVLPVDPDGDWINAAQAEPVPEPPPWAVSVEAERRAVLARADVFLGLHAPAEFPVVAPRVRWVQGVGAGVEQFARAGVLRGRTVVTNASGLSSGSMAEWVVGRLLQVWKRFREADQHQTKHAFVRTYGRTFAGSVIGIVGLGAIGRAVSERVRALGCRVLATRRSARPGDSSEHADALFAPDQLHALLAECDAVVVAAPSTAETRHLIDAKALAAMKPGAVLVNVARGTLLDEAALAEAMRGGRLGAAILDVFDPEPLDPGSPLWDLPGVYISAHSSVSVDRYMDDVFDLFVDNLERFTQGRPLRNEVDMQALGFVAGATP